eukprot:CAMPEP_0172431110 /NCGR_PEP_ID=MMETSP1064-20121228/57244_1 /TAXON_ID=202472 /ORGANISM="Aulacoseira subarctica , Strain CCAP 1002/5" /LENGTH=421 /DNA_ID=CAMNT_0013177599 /DNA_START=153 /DNA_END=1418 /DNA_ORIENTATION=-
MATMRRSTSHAYEAVNGHSSGSFASWIVRHSRGILATLAFLVTVAVLTSDTVQDNIRPHAPGLRGGRYPPMAGAVYPGAFRAEDAIIDANTFRFAAVTDLDQFTKIKNAPSDKPAFYSVLLPGILSRNPADGTYSLRFETSRKLVSKHNEAGRGMELSELTLFQNRLLSFDDRTGTVFELVNSLKDGSETFVVPRLVITEGDGDTDKGMKWEWATVKDGDLYMGSMGKEFTNPDGSVANTNNLWVSKYSHKGELSRENWTEKYNFVRNQLGAAHPGYIINEAVLWSDHLNSWVFLPRRVSSDAYDENKDERMGSNKIAIVNESFTSAKIIEIKFSVLDPLHGFSTFAFVPNTHDRHALAIRSVEEDCVGGDENLCKQRSYFVVFDVLTGEVLMDEQQYGENIKFEGVEFVNIYTNNRSTQN